MVFDFYFDGVTVKTGNCMLIYAIEILNIIIIIIIIKLMRDPHLLTIKIPLSLPALSGTHSCKIRSSFSHAFAQPCKRKTYETIMKLPSATEVWWDNVRSMYLENLKTSPLGDLQSDLSINQ